MFKEFCKNLLNYLFISLVTVIFLILIIVIVIMVGYLCVLLEYWALPLIFLLIVIVLALNKTYEDNKALKANRFNSEEWFELTNAYDDLTYALNEKNGDIERCRYEVAMFSNLMTAYKNKHGQDSIYLSYIDRYNDLKAFYGFFD